MSDRPIQDRRRNLIAKVLRELVRTPGWTPWPDYEATKTALFAKLREYQIPYDEYGPSALHDGISIVHAATPLYRGRP